MIKRLNFPESEKQYHIASCGPKAMQKVILYKKGIEVPEMDLIKIANTSRKGTPIESMLKIANKFNLNYFIKHNYSIQDLIDSVERENPAVLSVQGWPNKKVKDWLTESAFGHYINLTGFDTREEKIFYYDPYDGKIKSMSYEKLHLVAHDIDFKSRIEYNHFGIFFEN
jgi:hypothetical protein